MPCLSSPWALLRFRGTVAELHERSAQAVSELSAGGPAERALLVMEPCDRGLVLGSSQPASVADARACEREGVSIVRRKSGGGAVLVEPGGQLWVDVVLPAGGPLWEPDVGRAAWWLGEAWAKALEKVGVARTGVWKGPFTRRPGGHLSCFATLAGGEVTWGQRKVVGISQRRTRCGALFQCSCLLRWEPAVLTELLHLGAQDRARTERELANVARAVPSGAEPLLESLLASLPK